MSNGRNAHVQVPVHRFDGFDADHESVASPSAEYVEGTEDEEEFISGGCVGETDFEDEEELEIIRGRSATGDHSHHSTHFESEDSPDNPDLQ